MPLAKITFRPGVNKETTSYGNENGWFDSNLIRFSTVGKVSRGDDETGERLVACVLYSG